MELFRCPAHPNAYCMLKTGTKPGPTKDASFYVCGQCQFSVHTKLPPVVCNVHKTHTIELQSIVKNTSKQLRRYFRCPGRCAGESWCGYESFSKQTVNDTKVRNPVKSDLKETQCKSHSSKGHAETDSVVTHSKDTDTLTRDANTKNQKCLGKNEPPDLIIDKVNQGDIVSVNEKTNESLMEISFANLSKSRAATVSTSTEMNVSFSDKSFKQYRESPHLSGKNKSGQPTSRPAVSSDSDESGDESDVDESNLARKELEKLKISKKQNLQKPEIITVKVKSGNQEFKPLDCKTHDGKEGKLTLKTNSEAKINGDTSEISLGDIFKGSSTNNISNGGLINLESAQEKKIVTTQQITIQNEAVKPKVPAESQQSLLLKKVNLTNELHKVQSSMKYINVNSLPDKGQRILDKVKALQENIKEIETAMFQLDSQAQPGTNTENIQSKPLHNGLLNIDSASNKWAYPSSREDTNQNADPSKPDLVNSYQACPQPQQYVPDFMHLPQHLQQLFASNPQAMTLYGGRMTTQRLREVGSITTEAIDKLHKQLDSCPTEQTECSDPDGLKVTLKVHQRHALAWLAWREKQVPPGGILADDMGLGKTLTTISHIIRHKVTRTKAGKEEWFNRDKQVEKLETAIKKSGATLIVTPASLVHQWASEIERRCQPRLLKFHVYHGPNRERNIQKLIDNDIVLTTYAIVSKEVGADKQENADKPATDKGDGEETGDTNNEKPEELSLLLKIGWERIVLDEAHNIKNHKSLTAQSVCRLRAVYRWALTGTPIQNDLLDMYSLLRFLRFSPFDEFKVWKKHVDSGKGDTKRLNTIVKALLLRRTKEQTNIEGKPLVCLPSKSCETIQVELTSDERTVYERWFRKTQSTVQQYVLRHAEKDSDMVGSLKINVIKEDSTLQGLGGAFPHGAAQSADPTNAVLLNQGRSTGSQILVLLLRLRQCCSHLSLLKSHLEAASAQSDGIELTLEEQMKGMLLDDADREINGSSSLKSSTLFKKSSLSTKLKCLLEKISSIKSSQDSKTKDKSVVVSQWTQMLEVVAYHLEMAGIMYRIIQGDIPAKKRNDIVDDFNMNPKGAQVLLLSLQAGGVGLNLIGGNHLFLLDIHWNPALEEQACDRIYRMGQEKNVFIYRFLCKDTIEEKIVALQDRKRSLAKSVLSGGGASSQKLTLSDLRLLFGV